MKLPLRLLVALLFVVTFSRASATSGEENPADFAERWFRTGTAADKAGDQDAARSAYVRVLEREPGHLYALAAIARLERTAGHTDLALDWAGRFLERWRWLRERPAGLVDTHKDLVAYTLEADPFRKRADLLRREYVTKLLKLANEQLDQHAFHSARAMFLEAQATDPEHPELAAGLARISKEGGNELAVSDESGGVDPLAGVTAEWVVANDPLHAEWDKAWTLETEHYKIKTNAGYRVLKTTARAMEQVQVFYRLFHQYKTRGEGIPSANVWIYKDHDEYKQRGQPPYDWAGGHWDGATVFTYDSRRGGSGSLSQMLDTLFHEASHQFTTLAGGSGVPAWLNEGMASFFEGTKLLSNGKLDWNLVVPGRLYPLVEDLRSSAPHQLEDVIQGKVDDYRVFYPWGWGIVYYLYNAEGPDGRLLYRSAMKEYFQGYGGEKHVERFVEFFVTKPKRPGVATLADFEKVFREYVFDLERQDQGLVDVGRLDEERGDKQVKLGDHARAAELYARALEKDPDHPDVLWKLAAALEKTGETDRAAGMLRRWLTATAPSAEAADPLAERRVEALARIQKDDTSAKRLAEMRVRFHADALALAKEYDGKSLPRLALRVLRGPACATPPSVEARELYFAISDRSGVSLETWRLLFDERTLAGFYGGGEADFVVQDGVIIAQVGEDADNSKSGREGRAPSTGGGAGANAARKDTGFAFRRLFVDVEPAGDWSLQAEIKIERGGRMAGLCFGKKSEDVFHGIAILPEGYVDLTAFGTSPRTLQRVKTPIAEGWHRLRMEVAGTRLVVALDGASVLEWEFDSRAFLRGDFGLLAGLGSSCFRDIKLLEFDPTLPRRTAIGRRRAALDVDSELDTPLARAKPGLAAYHDEAPPPLTIHEWIGDAPAGGDLERLRGWPLVLVFWTTDQEVAVPLLPGLVNLAAKHADVKLPIVLVSNEPAEKVRAFVAKNPVPFPIAIDEQHKTYADYALPVVHLPHAKLLGLDGRVAWEGNPDYKPEYGTYLDEPVADLVAKSHLKELLAARPTLDAADAAFAAGDFAAAAKIWRPIVALDVPNEGVIRARRGLLRIDAEGAARLARARSLALEKRVLQAALQFEETARLFAGFGIADEAKQAHAALVKSKGFVAQRGLEGLLKSAERSAAAKKPDAARETLEKLFSKLEPNSDPSLRERAEALRAKLQAP